MTAPLNFVSLQQTVTSLLTSFNIKMQFQRPGPESLQNLGTTYGVAVKMENVPVNDSSGSQYNSDRDTFIIPGSIKFQPIPGDYIIFPDVTGKNTMTVIDVVEMAGAPKVPLAYKITAT